jgi:anti-anti-sigma regulatory factor
MADVILPDICDMRVIDEVRHQLQKAINKNHVHIKADKVRRISTPFCQLLAFVKHKCDTTHIPFIIEPVSDACEESFAILGLDFTSRNKEHMA